MEFRKLFYSTLCGLAIVGGFTSCDDDDEYDPYAGGSSVALPQYRGFVLNEGSSYIENSASISYFDAAKDTTTSASNDIFLIQNGRYLGDTGQSMIEYDGSLYVAVYGSSYVTKLNSAGVEQKNVSFNSYGAPRYMAADDGYLYVTTVNGYVVKLQTADLAFVDSTYIGLAPERICEEDDVLYIALGSTYDYPSTMNNQVAIINTNNFSSVSYITVMDNTQQVVSDDNYVFIQGYGNDFVITPVYYYNTTTKEVVNPGFNATYMFCEDETLYAVYSESDWSTYVTTNTFFTYNPVTGTRTDKTSQVTSQVSALSNSYIYCMSKNEYDDSFYISTTDYSTTGTIYHFDKNWNLLGSFTSWGVNANTVVVMR